MDSHAHRYASKLALRIALLLAAAACTPIETQGPTGSDGTDPGETADPAGAVCVNCSRAGGETSDFGGTSSPTPCEQSEVRAAIGAAEARALGFGQALDSIARTASVPFAWERPESGLDDGATATGYSESMTTLELETRVAELTHLVPQLAGCEDRLLAKLDVSLRTQDKAISIAGHVAGHVGRGQHQYLSGRLDLSTATGTLRVSAPAHFRGAIGYLHVVLSLWPDTVRGSVRILLLERDPPEPSLRQGAQPLDGRFPTDDCPFTEERPITPSTRSSALGGKSLDELRPAVVALLATRFPVSASWSKGGETSVTAEIGSPTNVCEAERGVGYRVPLQIRTDDGRVRIDEEARAWLSVTDDGTPDAAWFEITQDTEVPATSLASSAGIAGVDARPYEDVIWHSVIYLVTPPGETPRGELIVEGVEDGAIHGPVDGLSWTFR